jgi:hypothetical protein
MNSLTHIENHRMQRFWDFNVVLHPGGRFTVVYANKSTSTSWQSTIETMRALLISATATHLEQLVISTILGWLLDNQGRTVGWPVTISSKR